MTKKILFAAVAFLASGSLFAETEVASKVSTTQVENSIDEYKANTSEFESKWFVSLGAGTQTYFGDHDKQIDFGKRIAPALDIAVGRWFSPIWGARIMYSGLSSKGATRDDWRCDFVHGTGEMVPGWSDGLQYSKFKMGNLHADVMCNVLNLFGGYKAERQWELSPYVGIGWAHVYDGPSANSVTGNFGLLTSWQFSDSFALNLDVRGMLVSDKFDGEKGGCSGEGNLSTTIGFTYIFR